MTEKEACRIARIEKLDLKFSRHAWAFAAERRAEINSYFAKACEAKPLWNGRVLLLGEHEIAGDTLRGTYFEADFASFFAWRDWGFPDPSVRDCFAATALQGADGGFVLGVMGAQTANAGKIYFPSGTPDPGDRVGERVDLEKSARRELLEETGIAAEDCDIAPGWFAVFDRSYIAMIKPMRSRQRSDALQARIRDYLARSHAPELADVEIMRGASDLTPRMMAAMPPYVPVFLRYVWSGMSGGDTMQRL
jgi:8-oxo-dGTP pyrophosphatase MutT (NUDIX family)